MSGRPLPPGTVQADADAPSQVGNSPVFISQPSVAAAVSVPRHCAAISPQAGCPLPQPEMSD